MKINKTSKAVSLVLVAVFLFVFAFAGCGGQKADGSATEAAKTETKAGTAAAPEKEQVTLRLLTRWSGTDSYTPIWQAAQKEYMEKNPNVKFVDESINEEAAYNNKFKTDMATGNLPAIFSVNGRLVQVEYAKNGVLLDMQPYLEADKAWSDGFIEACINESKFDNYGVKGIYSLPSSNAIEVMYYNTELFAKAGIEKVPETFEELQEDIKKLKTSGVIPWGVGAKDTWRVGHIQNVLLYKLAGVDKAMDLGVNRKAKWTDPDVVKFLELLKGLKDLGAFEPNFEGIDYEVEKASFLSEKSAMVFNGTWFMGDVEKSPVKDKVKTFLFPYLTDKPEFKDHNIVFPQNLSVSGKLSEAEKKYTMDFLKMFTSREYQEKMAYETKNLPARKDVALDSAKTGALFSEVNTLASKIVFGAGDTFNYDPLPSMQDRTRNSFIGMLLGNTPEEAAKEIQDEIDRNK